MEKLIRTKKDLTSLEARLENMQIFEAKKFMITELLPLLQSWLDASIEDSQSNQEAIAALIESNEEMLHEETATQLCVVFELGIQVANAFLNRGQMDEIKEATFKKMAKEYISNAQNAMGLIAQIALGSSDDEDEDEESEDSDLDENLVGQLSKEISNLSNIDVEALINGSSEVEEKEIDSDEISDEGISDSTESDK